MTIFEGEKEGRISVIQQGGRLGFASFSIACGLADSSDVILPAWPACRIAKEALEGRDPVIFLTA